MTAKELDDAIYNSDYSTARGLLDRGVDVNNVTKWDNNTVHTPLLRAIDKSDVDAVNFLLAYGADPNYQCQIDGRYTDFPIFRAATDQVVILKALVKHGANLLQQNTTDGSLAIHKATSDNVLYLIACCNTEIALRQLYARDPHGRKLAEACFRLDPSQLGQRVRDATLKLERIFFSADTGDVEELVKCMKQEEIVDHADVNRRNHVGDTALHCASRTGQMAAIKFLLQEQKANRMVANDHSSLPLHLAARWNRTEVVQRLLTTDREPELVAKQLASRDVEGRTPADVCQLYGHSELVQFFAELEVTQQETLLLEAPANDNTRDSSAPASQLARTLHKPSRLDQLLEHLRIAEERISTLEADKPRLSTLEAENVGLSTRLLSLEAENARLATQLCELTNNNGNTVDHQSVAVGDAVCSPGSNDCVSSDCDNDLKRQVESLREDLGDLGTILTGRLERMEAQMDPQ